MDPTISDRDVFRILQRLPLPLYLACSQGSRRVDRRATLHFLVRGEATKLLGALHWTCIVDPVTTQLVIPDPKADDDRQALSQKA